MNQKLLQYESKKLFYNKYLYSLTGINQLGPIFRNKNFKYASTQLDILQAFYERGLPLVYQKLFKHKPVPETHFLDAKVIYNELTRYRKDYIVRIEFSTIKFYSNDKEFLLKLSEKLHNATEWHQPSEKYIEYLKETTNTIIVDDDTYGYKITFNHNRVNSSFADWLDNNKDKVKSTQTLRDDIKRSNYINGRYVYITTENVLMLVKIIAGDCIQRIDKLVSKQSIDK